jgi:hypothetical protein
MSVGTLGNRQHRAKTDCLLSEVLPMVLIMDHETLGFVLRLHLNR